MEQLHPDGVPKSSISDIQKHLTSTPLPPSSQTNGGRTISSQADLAAAAAQFAAHCQRARLAAADPPAANGDGKQRQEYPIEDTEMGGTDNRKGLSLDLVATGSRSSDPEIASPGSGSGSQGSSGSGAEKRRRPSWLSVFRCVLDAVGRRRRSGDLSCLSSSSSSSSSSRVHQSACAPHIRHRTHPHYSILTLICHHPNLRALYWREMLGAIRNPTDVAGRMLLFAYIGVACGLVFWRMGDGQGLESLHNRINVLFIMALQLLLMP